MLRSVTDSATEAIYFIFLFARENAETKREQIPPEDFRHGVPP